MENWCRTAVSSSDTGPMDTDLLSVLVCLLLEKKIIKKRGVCSLVINYVYESTLFIQTGNYFFIIGELNSQPFDHESGVTTGESSLTSSTAPQYDSNTITVT